MDCLIGYIGLKEITHTGTIEVGGVEVPETPGSGKWINDLALISTEMIASIGSPDNADTLETWQEIERRAADRFMEDVHEDLRAKFVCMPIARTTTEETYLEKINTYLCDNLAISRRAFEHLLGFEIINNALHTKRANVYSLTNVDRMKDLQAEYFRLYKQYLKGLLPQVPLGDLFSGPRQTTGYTYGYSL